MNKSHIKVRYDLLQDKKIKDNAVYLYMVLSTFKNNKTGDCYLKRETLSKVSGIKSLTTISNLLKQLEQGGYIKITTQYYDGHVTNNKYTLYDSYKFTYVSREFVLNNKINNASKSMYVKMKRFINNKSLKFFGAKKDFYKSMNCNINSLKKAIKELKENNIIELNELENNKIELTLTYDLNNKIQYKDEKKVENNYIKAWSNLNVESNPIQEKMEIEYECGVYNCYTY